MRHRLSGTLLIVLCLICSSAFGAGQGKLKLDVLDELGAGAKPEAEIFERRQKGWRGAPGASVALDPGTYKLVLPIVGGKIVRDELRSSRPRAYRLITNVAVLSVSGRNSKGRSPATG